MIRPGVFLLCLLPLPAAAFSVERDVSCAEMGVTPDMFLEWRSVEHILEEDEEAQQYAAREEKKPAPWERERHTPLQGVEKAERLNERFINVETTIFFNADLPDPVILDMRYRLVLEWDRIKPTLKQVEGTRTFYGSDSPPLEITVQHQDFYHVIDAQVTELSCHRIYDEEHDPEINPKPSIVDQLR